MHRSNDEVWSLNAPVYTGAGGLPSHQSAAPLNCQAKDTRCDILLSHTILTQGRPFQCPWSNQVVACTILKIIGIFSPNFIIPALPGVGQTLELLPEGYSESSKL